MTPLLEFSNLSKTIRDGETERCLWDGLSGEVSAGKMLALTGFSGSGKSTLLNTLSGVDRHYSGSIHALDIDYEGASEKIMTNLRAQSFGYVFQSFGLIEFLNVFDNVALGITRRQPYLDASEKQDVLDTLTRVGLDAHCHKDVRNLSGGEQQRVGVARAIVGKPKILFADEPTANLDARIGTGIMDLINEIRFASGMSVVIATHQQELVASADYHLSLGT